MYFTQEAIHSGIPPIIFEFEYGYESGEIAIKKAVLDGKKLSTAGLEESTDFMELLKSAISSPSELEEPSDPIDLLVGEWRADNYEIEGITVVFKFTNDYRYSTTRGTDENISYSAEGIFRTKGDKLFMKPDGDEEVCWLFEINENSLTIYSDPQLVLFRG